MESQSIPMSIHAKVMEDETDEEQETKSTLNFYIEPVSMKFVNKKDYRMNMPYTAYVRVSYFMAYVHCSRGISYSLSLSLFSMTGQDESDLLIQVTA